MFETNETTMPLWNPTKRLREPEGWNPDQWEALGPLVSIPVDCSECADPFEFEIAVGTDADAKIVSESE